jgi:hypothetical protein
MTIQNKPASTWAAVYDGQRCIGHILHRGKRGWEAFNVDDESIGLFRDQAAAADALEPVR